MIDAKSYTAFVKRYYSFLISEFDFIVSSEKVRGNTFYDIQYSNKKIAISISYENIEDYFQINIYLLNNGYFPDYDDKTKTLNLSKVNALVIKEISKKEIELNNDYFLIFEAHDHFQKKLIKSAKELRLSMKHLKEFPQFKL
ncbi:hypothetical protein GCM10023149_51930 [Mucilaginibacter gynuensis]|uniref:DUF4304 domain-containing protein n=1 Tax=Mucilaginibacter gynuensis TaxID=1302236 RepID=A0ABP8HK94_9SPHI